MSSGSHVVLILVGSLVLVLVGLLMARSCAEKRCCLNMTGESRTHDNKPHPSLMNDAQYCEPVQSSICASMTGTRLLCISALCSSKQTPMQGFTSLHLSTQTLGQCGMLSMQRAADMFARHCQKHIKATQNVPKSRTSTAIKLAST